MSPPGAAPGDDPFTRLGARSLLLVGAGKMGGAMLDGWLRAGLPPVAVAVVEAAPSPALREAAGTHGFALDTGWAGREAATVVVLAVKPQHLDAATEAVTPAIAGDTLLVSIMAGKTISDIGRAFPAAGAVVRAMPNLPASIGQGATGAFANAPTREDQRRLADRLLRAVGGVEWLETEDLLDAVTAVSGSGPAYLFHLAECLGEAGAAAGLEPALAQRLARATVIGAAELLAASDQMPARLRENVTSPGGTTAAALAVLMGERGLAPLMREAVLAAKARSEALSG